MVRQSALAAMIVAVVAPAAAQAPPTNFTCAGSEPFWSLAVNRDGARFDSPNEELLRGGSEFRGRMSAVANHKPITFAWRGRGTGNSDLVALLMPQQCLQPSGETAPYRVWISLPDGAALTGCCR